MGRTADAIPLFMLRTLLRLTPNRAAGGCGAPRPEP